MNLKLLMDEVLYEEPELLLCGGAAGHMLHPYDKFETAQDMLEFFENFLAGQIKGTEKVDGYNLFVGLNDDGEVVAVRNKNEKPMKDITKKFGLNHPAHNGFTAGYEAIKEKLESLNDRDRLIYGLWEDGEPKNFINMEILYGYIPNVVPYSQTTNYIVFHNFVGNPDNNWSPIDNDNQDAILRTLAESLGPVKIITPNVTFSGDPDNVRRDVKDVESNWEFVGPLEITKKDIKKSLEKVASSWKKFPQVKALIEFAEKEDDMDLSELTPLQLQAHQEKKYELMKKATKKIGAEVLNNMASKLSDTGEVIPGYPGIEGIVTKQGGDLVKITGDFLDYSRPSDAPSLDATKKLRLMVQKDILGLPTTTLRGVKTKEQLYDYIIGKKKKTYGYELDQGIPKSELNKVRETIKSSKEDVRGVVDTLQEKGRAYDVKNLLTQTFMLTNIQNQLDQVETYKDLVDVYAKELYGVE